KGLAIGFGKPYLAINHLEGHLLSPFFSGVDGEVGIRPNVSLIVSGGHTMLVRVHAQCDYQVVGRTVDDAAGEAFDKVAKLLALGYPGGPIIEKLAREGNPKAVKFALPRMGDNRPDFSFSGLKTAVTKHVRESGLQPMQNGEEPSQPIKDLAASFQSTVVRSLVSTMERVAREYRPRTLIVAGGVACNGALREASRSSAQELDMSVYFAS